jgi:hypothetical protein
MSQVSFLLDEHMPTSLINAVVRMEPSVTIMRIGQPGMPPKRTPDPEVVEFAEANQMAVFTFDKSTMGVHADARVASGSHTYGVFIWTKKLLGVNDAAWELVMIWSASEAEEWMDRVEYLPL